MSSSTEDAESQEPLPREPWFSAGCLLSVFPAMIVVYVLAHGAIVLLGRTMGEDVDAEGWAEGIPDSPIGILVGGAALQLMLLFLAFLNARVAREPFVERVRLVKPRWTPLTASLLVLGTPGLSYLVLLLLGASGLEIGEGLVDHLATLREYPLPAILVAVLLPGFCEELLFRGAALRGMSRKMRPGIAVAVIAVVFGVLHPDLLQAVFAVVLGLWLGFLALASRSIWVPIGAHLVNNLTTMLAVILAPAEDITDPAAVGSRIEAWGLWTSVGLLVLGLASYVLRERRR